MSSILCCSFPNLVDLCFKKYLQVVYVIISCLYEVLMKSNTPIRIFEVDFGSFRLWYLIKEIKACLDVNLTFWNDCHMFIPRHYAPHEFMLEKIGNFFGLNAIIWY